MKNSICIVVLFTILLACNSYTNNNYTNSHAYHIGLNEQVEIYYSTNSCCYYCIANLDALRHVSFIQSKMYDRGKSDCEGCNYQAAFVFEGKSTGVDTLIIKHHTAGIPCDSLSISTQKYIIHVNL
jgi:hypothetical protein